MLSGRTRTRTRIKDQNIGYIAEYLTAIDIDLKEVRVVGDEESNRRRTQRTPASLRVFTTGGTEATHADITAECRTRFSIHRQRCARLCAS